MASPIVKKVLDRLEGQRQLAILESNNEIKNPKLWDRAKTLAEEKYKVYSPDAHGWAIRWYQRKDGVFNLVQEGKEECGEGKYYCNDEQKCKTIPEGHKVLADGELVKEAATTRIPAQNGNVYDLMYSWRGKTYFCKMFFPQPGKPNKKEVQTALNQVYPSAILRSFVISAVNYGDPYIHAGTGDGFKLEGPGPA